MDPLTLGILGGSTLLGGLLGSNATKKAANAQANATAQQIALEREQFAQTQANLKPYMDAGQPGINALTGRLNDGAGVFGGTQDPTYSAPQPFRFTADDYKASPAYQIQLNEGLNAITGNMATRGALNSGATIKAAMNYAQDQALKDFQGERAFAYGQYGDQRNFDRGLYTDDRNYLTNRYDQQTGVAGELATIGGNAAAGVGNAGAGMTSRIGNALQNQASTTANAGLVNAANTNSLISQSLNAYMNRTPTSYTPPPVQASNGWYGTNLSGFRL